MTRPTDPDDPDQTRIERIDPLIGTLIADRYRIEMKLASGGFGAIYRAFDLGSERDVALKLLHPKLTQDRAVLARFRREGAALATLRDPHTVTAYDIGETRDGVLYISMELLEGQSLYETYGELGQLPWRRVVAISIAVCSSLAEAHALGIVHRDLKPANIHLERRGDEVDYVKVLDFGIAKIIHGEIFDNSDLTNVGQMIGTFEYMAPEQMVGGECTGQADIFTLGVVMYEMICGARPFGAQQTAASMLATMLTTMPPPMADRADVPPELERIILRCLARRPEDRFADVGELARVLEQMPTRELTDQTHARLLRADSPAATTKMDAVAEELFDDTAIQPQATDRMPSQPDEGWADSSVATVPDPPPKKPKFLPSHTLPGVAAPEKKPKRDS